MATARSCVRCTLTVAALLTLWFPAGSAADAQGVTTIRLTDEVLVEDCSRFGINLGGDNYYSGAVLRKRRVEESFEGTSYRQCHFGPVWKENGCSTWFGVPQHWRDVFVGDEYVILSGPDRWTKGTLQDVTSVRYQHHGEWVDQDFFLLDRKIEPPSANGGIMVQSFPLDQGQLRPHHHYWLHEDAKVHIGDPPPGSFGVAACNLDGRKERCQILFSTHYHRYGELNGTWHVRFWAKAKSGNPELRVGVTRDEFGGERTDTPPPEWRRYEFTLVADAVPEPQTPKESHHLLFHFSAVGGEVLIDDVEAWLEGDSNPTAFRDDCVNMLKTYNPGCIRYLQMGGNTVPNTLKPRLRAHSFTSRKGSRPGPYQSHNKQAYGLHEMYELCEHVGAEPWYCLPGTLTREEMEDFMEYLGGPVTTEYGKLRAELGHPEPWTEVFHRIHVEFGNEAWNNASPYQLGGYNGDNYWQDLIATGKDSPYYKPNVLFHAAGQAASSSRNQSIMARVPNADRFGVAPYIIHTLNEEDMELLDTKDKFFRWAFAWPIRRSRSEDGAMYRNYQLAKEAGIELSIYEVNHHTTHGSAPLEPRNQLVTSIGGGLNVANNMLQMLKEHHLRTQALFSLVQRGYDAHGVGVVRLWGTALNMREGHERYRPTFLACALANDVLGGDLVETVHEGADPTFSATGVFSRRRGVETIEDIPTIWSYGFAEGKRRGLILVNLDTSQQQPVAVEFDGEVAGPAAQARLLTADSITANNEFERPEPQVHVRESRIGGFTSGSRITLPPFSMLALEWEVQ